MPHNNEEWNDSGQPVGGTDDNKHFRIMKTLADGTVVTTSSGGGSNPAAGPTGAPVPADADFIGFQDGSGNLQGVSAANPLPVTASFTATGPNVFKQVSTAAAGDTVVWTPALGKKFRLMRFKIEVTADASKATTGTLTIQLRDNAIVVGLTHLVWVIATADARNVVSGYISDWIDLGAVGYLSATANNPLNVNLSSALTAGLVNVIAIGTEE
jgi:hypothetical protein